MLKNKSIFCIFPEHFVIRPNNKINIISCKSKQIKYIIIYKQ